MLADAVTSKPLHDLKPLSFDNVTVCAYMCMGVWVSIKANMMDAIAAHTV